MLLPTPVSDNSRGLPSSSTDYASLANFACSLLPTPDVGGGGKTVPNDAVWSGNAAYKPDGTKIQVSTESAVLRNWGDYADAIARWEPIIGRPAPEPTEVGAKGNPRLSPKFCEWMMGLPEGHVTNVPGLSRNNQLKALGNGVVPQQCAAATRALLADLGLAEPSQAQRLAKEAT